MKFSETTVELSRIRESDTTFRVTSRSPADRLAASIAEFGLLHPPVLQMVDSDYRIITGFRRVQACRMVGIQRIRARIPGPDASLLDCVRYAILDNTSQRDLTLMEQSRSLALLTPLISDPATLRVEAGRLGLPENPGIIRKLNRLSGLPKAIQEMVESEAIPLSMALELGQMKTDEAILFAGLLDELKIGLNRQRELLSLVQEIAGRDNVCVTEVLRDRKIRDIRQDPSRDRTQKAVLLREYLRERRYPAITRNQEEFQKRVQELDLPPGIRLIPPAGFEGTEYQFSILFQDLDSLRDRLASLVRAADREAMAAILRRWKIRDS